MTTKSNTSTNYSVSEVAANLRSVGLPPDWSDETNLLVANLYREIAKGQPITPQTADKLLTRAGIDLEEGREFLAGVTERNDNGDIVGAVGLTQNPYPHKFVVEGTELATWCAWDTLFIAQVLNKTVQVTSNSPDDGTEIKLEVGPEGVSAPKGAVVSFVLLDPEDIDMDSLESVYMVFCHQIHFFASREAAEKWTGERDYKFAILSIDEAFEVGSKAFADMIKFAE